MSIDIAILTVIPPELSAVREALGMRERPEKLGSGTNVWSGSIKSTRAGRSFSVVMACVGGAGNADAASATTELLMSYAPRFAVLVGIAAGLRDKLKIGNVVLSERVVAYEGAAQEPDRDSPRPDIIRPDHSVEQDIAAYLASYRERRYRALFRAKVERTWPSPTSAQSSEYAEHVASALEVRASTLASGEKLLRDPTRFIALRSLHGKIEVGEMEASGFTSACRLQRVPWLVVRGISDFGDSLKDDRFHRYASASAGAALLDFCKFGLDLPINPAEGAHNDQSKRELRAERRYRELALEVCDIIDLAGLPEDAQVAKKDLALREIYIPLRVRREPIEEGESAQQQMFDGSPTGPEPIRPSRNRPTRSVDDRVSLGQLLKTQRRIVVLADPGGGKSTLLRWLATAYLLRLKKDPTLAKLPDLVTLPDDDLLPIVVRCRDLDDECVEGTLEDILTRTLRKSELSRDESDALGSIFRRRLLAGTALLLVDGLDEITATNARGRFCKQLERVSTAFPMAAVIVTSRIVGYREMGFRLGRDFVHTQITELSSADKNAFAKRWVALTEPADRRTRKTEELIEGIHGTDRIERLTSNPMMLTTLALVKRKVGRLPQRRAELYQETVHVLLNWRADVDEPIDKAEALPQLEYIAWEMCRRGLKRLPEPSIIGLLEGFRVDFPNVRPVLRHTPEEFLRLLERRTSILVQMGTTRMDAELVPVYEFRHLTFQEYLAGVAMVRSRYPAKHRPKTLAERVGPLAGEAVRDEGANRRTTDEDELGENWTEAIRLCVATCNDDDVDDVLRAIAGVDTNGSTGRDRAVLAALCLADEPNVTDSVAQELVELLVKFVGDADGRGNVRTALDTAVMLLALSDWHASLSDALLDQFLLRPPEEGIHTAGLHSLMSRRSLSGDLRQDDEHWLPTQLRAIASLDERCSVSGALCLMDFHFYASERSPAPGLLDLLLPMLRGTAWQQFAAAWTLMWLDRAPRPGQRKVSRTQLNEDQVSSLLYAMEPSIAGARFLCRFLDEHWDDRFTPSMLGFLAHPSTEVRQRAVGVLARHRSQVAEPALRGMLLDGAPAVQRSALTALFGYYPSPELQDVLMPGGELAFDPGQPLPPELVAEAASRMGIRQELLVEQTSLLGLLAGPPLPPIPTPL